MIRNNFTIKDLTDEIERQFIYDDIPQKYHKRTAIAVLKALQRTEQFWQLSMKDKEGFHRQEISYAKFIERAINRIEDRDKK